ncbi:MotA/TolQ/ExbB proton channel family protein [Chryseotalea sanaruensis]|jgi:biopolymer transport protein ExbB|uniref:MotA/TolQ/ExbB proton channel family protein n=1 Tax=Chryseotalea sanaruensis TaxID=2482724 RepID=A0A401U4T3_9BACT|nr:MotA/TolQ/ExbB proton channel family protein [Chryseotalea sanaruensis]GCC49796.1 MotA/TolQ/ExbB proton channel family protein [Chryseotalea sanaruensis]
MIAQITTEVAASESISVLDLALKGGWVMLPLALMWIAAIYLFIERLLTINKANMDPEPFMNRVKELVQRNDIQGAKLLCAQSGTPVARMIEKGVSRIGSPLKNIEASIENVGKLEIFKLEKNLSTLATISGAAPMIGFLGTVIGMVQAFISISQEEGSVSPKLLSNGIYEAMITTVGGLIVGIMAYLAYNYLVTRVAKVIHKMEYTSIDFIDLLQEPR